MLQLQALKDWLGITDDAQDSLIQELEVRAVAFLEQQTGRYLRGKTNVVEIIVGHGTQDLWLRDVPTDLGAVAVEEFSSPGADPRTITAADEDGFIPRAIGNAVKLVRKGSRVWTAGYEYSVSYERGYTVDAQEPAYLTDAPEELVQAAIDLVALKYHGRGQEGLESETIGGYSYRAGDLELVPGLEETIEAWRWRYVG